MSIPPPAAANARPQPAGQAAAAGDSGGEGAVGRREGGGGHGGAGVREGSVRAAVGGVPPAVAPAGGALVLRGDAGVHGDHQSRGGGADRGGGAAGAAPGIDLPEPRGVPAALAIHAGLWKLHRDGNF